MKKTLLIAVALVLIAGPAFAAYGSGTVTLGSSQTMDVQTSNNVQIDYGPDTTNSGATFAAATYHSKGTRTYASSSGDAKIYYQATTAVASPSAPAIGSTMANTGWTAL